MDVYIKETIYFKLSVEDGTNRSQVTESFHQVISPQFEQILSSIKFDKADEKAFRRLTGHPVKLKILSKNEFIKENQS